MSTVSPLWPLGSSTPRARTTLAAFAFVLGACAVACGSPEEEGDVSAGASAQTATTTWFSLAPKQADNPWDECRRTGGSLGGTDRETPPEAGEGALVRSCLGERGATLGTIVFLTPTGPVGRCLSMSCPRGDTLVVEATTIEAGEKLRGLGFTPLEQRGYAKAVCDDREIPVTSAFEQQFGAQRATDWASDEAIDVTGAGIAYAPTRDDASCGYRAVFTVAADASATALEARGYEPLKRAPY